MSAPTWKEKLESIRARHAAASRGPWRWFGYLSNRDVGLEGSGGTVMEFARWGLRGGQPLFSIKGILYDLVKFVVPDTTEGRGRVTDINHPDARFIAASWEDVRDLLARVDELETSLTQCTSERNSALGLLRSARATLQHLGSSHDISEHAYQELACHLDDEPLGADGGSITITGGES